MITYLQPLSQEFIEASPESLQSHHCRWQSVEMRWPDDVKQRPDGSEMDEKPRNDT